LARVEPRGLERRLARDVEEDCRPSSRRLRRGGRGGALLRVGRQQVPLRRRAAHVALLHAAQAQELMVGIERRARREARGRRAHAGGGAAGCRRGDADGTMAGMTIADLLHEAAETHHVVYRIVDGDDPDWASWYADWLLDHSELPELLGRKPVRS